MAGVISFGQAGLNCPKCGAGFVPPGLQWTKPAPRRSAAPWLVIVGVVALSGVFLIFGSDWLGAGAAWLLAPATIIVIILILLLGIFVRLGRLTRKQ